MGKWKRQGRGITAIVMPQLKGASAYATDRATTFAFKATQDKIVSVGLGRLSKAVGSTSSLKRGRRSPDGKAWGAIYAKSATEGRGNQALLAYSEGAAIFPLAGKKWLAFATGAIPSRVGRKKMTPALYNASQLVSTIGKLRFVPKNSRVAYLVANNVTQSRKTGRVKAFAGKTPRGADRKKSVVAFVLIRWTRRAQRFSQPEIMLLASAQVPRFALEYQQQQAGRG